MLCTGRIHPYTDCDLPVTENLRRERRREVDEEMSRERLYKPMKEGDLQINEALAR